MDEGRARTQLSSSDDAAARAAFDALFEAWRAFARACIRATGVREADAEDVAQAAFLRIWNDRRRFRDQGALAWRAYLRTMATWCAREHLRGPCPPVPLDDEPAPPPPDSEVWTVLGPLMEADARERLYAAADVLWLGLDPALPPETHRRQLLAAQLFYLDGAPWDEVLRLLAPGPGSPPLTRQRLDDWLVHPGVLRLLAFHTLFYANDRLTGHLLALPEPVSGAALDALLRRATAALSPTPPGGEPGPGGDAPPGGWTWPEVAVIFWRYRYALLAEVILSRHDCPVDGAGLEDLVARTLARFPFTGQMRALLAALDPAVGRGAHAALGESGLWRRLAFQYRHGEDLPHHDICDRTHPAAQQVGAGVTAGQLNGWLSGGRLCAQLCRFCAARTRREEDGDA